MTTMLLRNLPTRFTYSGLTVVLAFAVLWHFYNFMTGAGYHVAWTKDNSPNKAARSLSEESIPNLAHFVYILKDSGSDLIFRFSDFLSVYAAYYYWRPKVIYLHTDAPEETINRARDGLSGKWSRLIFRIPGLRAVPALVPSHASNGAEISLIEHKSDFVRVQAIRKFGGTYIDFDAHPLRDIKVLRESGFNAISGRQFGGQVMSGTFMSKKSSKMISLWAEEMHKVYDGGWTTHSNEVITRVSEHLVAEPGEMLIMEREAFGPGSWNSEDCVHLFEVHNDTTSNLEGIVPSDGLPSFNDGSADTWNHSEMPPPWADDWSRTYILHAFNPKRSGIIVNGFDRITPRYVLERRSNFARAVYPIAKILYERGLFEINDS
ncbi:glycosyl transferase [Pochonia chlamydosporia 170]|uniref:Glycosyl transferase n=1 Tax=Pochonia chlamydosporia 170 TaxID=1380566 RepID=A0A179FNU3_METCM|nr:glycosyl transferase [Pochonia chlamydosporia 170]OAQ67254.1 glycosyl transferase [Pochonia chlamydosporia 170]